MSIFLPILSHLSFSSSSLFLSESFYSVHPLASSLSLSRLRLPLFPNLYMLSSLNNSFPLSPSLSVTFFPSLHHPVVSFSLYIVPSFSLHLPSSFLSSSQFSLLSLLLLPLCLPYALFIPLSLSISPSLYFLFLIQPILLFFLLLAPLISPSLYLSFCLFFSFISSPSLFPLPFSLDT